MEQYSSDQISGKSPRRQLQGPRPTPLKVRKDSHKIKKPHQQQQQQQTLVHRPPVIIYMVSPKIIHVNPNEFMQIVQRLTGPPSSSSSPVSTNNCSASPTSLQPVPSNSFSPPILDQNPIGYFHDLSPVLHSNRNFIEGGFISPSNNFLSPNLYYSPTPSPDIFSNFFGH